MEEKKRLTEILKTMDVPQGRLEDLRWLARNITCSNWGHRDLEEAKFLIKRLLAEKAEKSENPSDSMIYLTNGCCEAIGSAEELPEQFLPFIYDDFVERFLLSYSVKYQGRYYHAPQREYNFRHETTPLGEEYEEEDEVREMVLAHEKILQDRSLKTFINYFDYLGDRHTLGVLIDFEWISINFADYKEYRRFLSQRLKLD